MKTSIVWLLALCACRAGDATPSPPGIEIAETPSLPVLASAQQASPDDAVAAPFTLTASDGSELVVARVDAKAVIEGPLAYTELHLYFTNAEPRVREGTFAITLPSGAAVSRFAVEIDGKLQEAEVVEKAYARRVYEDFLHRKQDPALLEKAAGNQFSARVFPIPANDTKHIVISYSQALVGMAYEPLPGLPAFAHVEVFNARTAPEAAIAAGSLVVASLTVPEAKDADAPPHDITLLVDTSGSRALRFISYVRSIHALVDSLRTHYDDPSIEVIAFDQDVEPIYRGPTSLYDDTALRKRGAAGASDLAQALKHLTPRARVLIVTDAVMTAGDDAAPLAAQLKTDRIDVVLAGGIRDERYATTLARAGRQHPGDVLDLDRGADAVAAALGKRVLVDVPIRIAEATWSYPQTLPAARPGSKVMVFAKLAKPARAIDVTVGNTRTAIGLAAGSPLLVERAVAGAEIEELDNELAVKPTDELRAEIAKRSVRARVVSSQTSMLVLETEDDYARYHIDRRALADILTIDAHGKLGDVHRTKPVLAKQAQGVEDTLVVASNGADAPDDSGGTGTAMALEEGRMGRAEAHLAVSSSGYATVSARVANVPAVSIGQPTVSGDLDKTMIRRYIHRYLAQIRYCYEHALVAKPSLDGTVMTRFSIEETGKVSTVTADGVDDEVSSCVAGVIGHIEFPAQHNGGKVIVNYPFVFQREGQPPPAPAPVPVVLPPVATPPSPPPVVIEFGKEPSIPALTGKLAEVTRLIRTKKLADAVTVAKAWHDDAPGDVLALVGYGEALEATKDQKRAARMYGSIIDLYSTRADLRRFAGERLERLGARTLVIDTYRRAVADRPDHITGHRLLAYALLRHGDYAAAFAAILVGVDKADGDRTLSEDAGLVGAVYLAHGGDRKAITAELEKRSLALATTPSTRFILYWETDANDVDFHIRDAQGGHAFYKQMKLPSGGELYRDITTGYGPECFAIEGKPSAGPYKVSINYYSQGPMGYGMGLLQIERFDGKSISFDDRPYVIMNDHAFVDLGSM